MMTVFMSSDERSGKWKITEEHNKNFYCLQYHSYLETSIKAVRREPWLSRGSTLFCGSDVQNGSRSEAKDWLFYPAGNGCIALAIVSPSGCCPAKMASTISGAISVIRSSQRTNNGLMFSTSAICLMVWHTERGPDQ
jgi:hypothetical protein